MFQAVPAVNASGVEQTWWGAGLVALAQGGPTALILAFVVWFGFKLLHAVVDRIGGAMEKLSAAIVTLSEKDQQHTSDLREHVSEEHGKTRELIRARGMK